MPAPRPASRAGLESNPRPGRPYPAIFTDGPLTAGYPVGADFPSTIAACVFLREEQGWGPGSFGFFPASPASEPVGRTTTRPF